MCPICAVIMVDIDSPGLRYTLPEHGFPPSARRARGASTSLNNGMRYGLVWAVQPRHYNDSMDELLTQPLSRYVQELIRIRTNQQEQFALSWAIPGYSGSGGEGGVKHVRYLVFEGLDNPGQGLRGRQLRK